jgi:filamentous hemagglutinin family protein
VIYQICGDRSWKRALTGALVIGGAIASPDGALAQLTPDDTLGAEGSRVRPDATVDGRPADLIEGGTTCNANLFHSFQEFNVEEQQRVYFDNPADIDNIFSRVTGDNPSNILGTLGVDGAANLFLLNPNGILFGSNASLDIQGSLLATTGNGFLFNNNEVFSATNPEAPSLLAVSVPLGVQYGANLPGAITVQGSTLRVDEAQSLILAGGEVVLEDALLAVAVLENGQVGAREGGRIDIGAVAGAGNLELSETNNLLGLGFPENLARADVRLTDTTTLNVQANNGGELAITAQNIVILEESELLAGIDRGLGFPSSQAGDFHLDATRAIRIDESFLFNIVDPNATGNAGNIEITTGTLQVSNGSRLEASTFGQGNAGDVIINARDRVSIDDGVRVFSIVDSDAIGTASNVEITTGTLQVSNDSQVGSGTFGQGNAGDVIINARDRASIDDRSGVFSVVESGAVGTAGNVEITTGTLRLSNVAQLASATRGRGNAGDVIINARDHVSFDGTSDDGQVPSGVFSTVELGAVGTGGNVVITTGTLQLSNGAQLISATSGRGDAGNVIINTRDQVSFDGRSAGGQRRPSGVFTRVTSRAIGTGGNVVITTRALSVTNGAGLFTETGGQGRAGNVIIRSAESTTFSDGTIETETEATGRGGDIDITTASLNLVADSTISATATNSAAATERGGDIRLNAAQIQLSGSGSAILAETQGAAGAGSVQVQPDGANPTLTMTFADGDRISAETSSQQPGGSLVVRAPEAITLSGNGILSARSTGSGQAGNLTFATEQLTLQDGVEATVSSTGNSTAGTLTVQGQDVVLSDGSRLVAETEVGQGGDIDLQVGNSFHLRNGSAISATTHDGQGGNITITPGSNAASNTIALQGQSQISSDTRGRGSAGSIVIQRADAVTLDNSAISTAVRPGAVVIGQRVGNIDIQTRSLSLTNNANITASTAGRGNAGNITIADAETVSLSDSTIATAVEQDASGQGGRVDIQTNSLSLTDGAAIAANSNQVGTNAGNIGITASGELQIIDSDITIPCQGVDFGFQKR